MVYGLQAFGGHNVNNNADLKRNLEQLVLDVETNSSCSKWEKLQVNALQSLSTNNIEAAIRQWEEILVEFPSDILSVHLAGLACLMSGRLGAFKNYFRPLTIILNKLLDKIYYRHNSRYFWSDFAIISRRIFEEYSTCLAFIRAKRDKLTYSS